LVGNAEEIRRGSGVRPRSMGKAATEETQLSMASMCARTVVGRDSREGLVCICVGRKVGRQVDAGKSELPRTRQADIAVLYPHLRKLSFAGPAQERSFPACPPGYHQWLSAQEQYMLQCGTHACTYSATAGWTARTSQLTDTRPACNQPALLCDQLLLEGNLRARRK
jgi:hypothetical protein